MELLGRRDHRKCRSLDRNRYGMTRNLTPSPLTSLLRATRSPSRNSRLFLSIIHEHGTLLKTTPPNTCAKDANRDFVAGPPGGGKTRYCLLIVMFVTFCPLIVPLVNVRVTVNVPMRFPSQKYCCLQLAVQEFKLGGISGASRTLTAAPKRCSS
jgi:hypothetical protein